MTADTSPAKQAPLERYLSILEVVAASQRRLNLTELAELMDLPKPTVHRLVGVLIAAGALQVDDARQRSYAIGTRMWKLLRMAQNQDVVANLAQIVCDKLTDQVGETSYIVKLGHDVAQTVARSVPDRGYRLHVFPGHELPAHAASSVKALLAYQDDAVRARLLREPLQPLTEFTKTDRQTIDAELNTVREMGYAICDREIDTGVMAYSCPVHLPDAGVIYSVGLTGPCTRLNQRDKDHWISALQTAADHFGRLLSQSEPADSHEMLAYKGK